jgi:hypothetical protein
VSHRPLGPCPSPASASQPQRLRPNPELNFPTLHLPLPPFAVQDFDPSVAVLLAAIPIRTARSPAISKEAPAVAAGPLWAGPDGLETNLSSKYVYVSATTSLVYYSKQHTHNRRRASITGRVPRDGLSGDAMICITWR